MIKINALERNKIQSWYAKQMVPHIRKKQRHIALRCGTDPFLQKFVWQLNHLTETEIRDILLVQPEELLKKYDWIRQYVKLCDACAFFGAFHQTSPQIKDKRAARNEFIRKYDCVYLKQAFREAGLSEWDAICSWKKLTVAIRHARKMRDELNAAATQIFKYGFLDELEMRGLLVEKMNVPVCPYCNKQYIQPFPVGKDMRYLGDIDHILPKLFYSLFSLSLWNLVPCCKSCNQVFKRASTKRLLNPHERGFDCDCILELRYKTVRELVGIDEVSEMEWEVQPKSKSDAQEEIKNNIQTFHLNESYDYHKRDIQLVLRKRFLMGATGYGKSLKRIGVMSAITEEPRLLYGVSLDPSKFQEELLAKAIYDTIYYN